MYYVRESIWLFFVRIFCTLGGVRIIVCAFGKKVLFCGETIRLNIAVV